VHVVLHLPGNVVKVARAARQHRDAALLRGTITPVIPASWKARRARTCSWRRMSTVAGPRAVCITRCGT